MRSYVMRGVHSMPVLLDWGCLVDALVSEFARASCADVDVAFRCRSTLTRFMRDERASKRWQRASFTTSFFESFVIACILVNTVIMALDHFDPHPGFPFNHAARSGPTQDHPHALFELLPPREVLDWLVCVLTWTFWVAVRVAVPHNPWDHCCNAGLSQPCAMTALPSAVSGTDWS